MVYTPDYIARFIVEQTVGTHIQEIFDTVIRGFTQKKSDNSDYENILWKNKSAERKAWLAYRDRLTTLRIIDPACGSGVFLVMAFDYLKGELNRVNDKIAELEGKSESGFFDPDSEILTNNLFGVDVNSESVEIAKLSLWIKTARRGKVLDSLDGNIMVGDSLIEDSNYAYLDHAFTWQTAFPDIFAEGGFDIVLGNPPYVRQELLKPLKPYLQKRFEVYHGVADLYCYFFERGLRILKPNGRLGYISSGTFFKTSSGKPLREFLLDNATMEHVVGFGDTQIFEGVTTYPAILIMQQNSAAQKHTFSFWNVSQLPQGNFRATYKNNAQFYPQSELDDGSWELENPALRKLRSKIRSDKPTLEEIYASPLYGIKTGRNEAFVISRTTRDRLIAEDPNSAPIIRPWLIGKDVKCWRTENHDKYLILFPKGWTNDSFGLGEEDAQWQRLQRSFPAISDHLSVYSEVCRKRTDQGDYWWELRSCDYYSKFEDEKIVYRDISSTPTFSIEPNGSLCDTTCYFIPSGDPFLLAILNSEIFSFHIKSETPLASGGYYRYKTQYIVNVPIPSAADIQKEKLAKLAETCQIHAEARYVLQEGLRRPHP